MTAPPSPAGDDGVEELAQPDAAKLRRLRLDLGIGALVLFAVLLVVKWKGGGDDPTGSAATTTRAPSSSSSVATPRSAEPPPVFPVDTRAEGNRARCPRGFQCPVSPVASAGIQRALEAAFPDVRIVAARTVRSVVTGYGQAIWAADVRARAGDHRITLRLQPLSPQDAEKHSTIVFGGHSITRWEGILSQLLVVIDVVSPADHPASLTAVEQLARDGQMLSPW
jgi:hypothetical protein